VHSAVVPLKFAAYQAGRVIRTQAARKGFKSYASRDASDLDIRSTLSYELLPVLGTRLTSWT
jgi:hypothetical protein